MQAHHVPPCFVCCDHARWNARLVALGCAVKTRVFLNNLQATSASVSHLKLSVIAAVAISFINRQFITVSTSLYTSTADSSLQPVNLLPCVLSLR
jgi:hypothetical protein